MKRDISGFLFDRLDFFRVFDAATEEGETHNKFFGGIGSFKKNWLKQARCKAMQRTSLADDAPAGSRFQSPHQ